MNQYSTDKIKELKAILLTDSKEWKKNIKKLEGRLVYWSYKQRIFTIRYICPMTYRVYFVESISLTNISTNAISELYLIPNK